MPNFFDGIKKNFQSDAQAWAEKTGRSAKEYKDLPTKDKKQFTQERFTEAGAAGREKRREAFRQKQVKSRVEAARAGGRSEVVSESRRGLRSFFSSRLEIITSGQVVKEDFRSTLAALFNTRKETLLHPPKPQPQTPNDFVEDAARDIVENIDLEENATTPESAAEQFYTEPLPNVLPGEFRPENRQQVGQLLEGIYNSLVDESGRAMYGTLNLQKTAHGFVLSKPYQSATIQSQDPAYAKGLRLTLRTDKSSPDPTREAGYIEEATNRIFQAFQTEAEHHHRLDPELLNFGIPETVEEPAETTSRATPLEDGVIHTGSLGGQRGQYGQQPAERRTEEEKLEILARREAAKRRERSPVETAYEFGSAARAEPVQSVPTLDRLNTKLKRTHQDVINMQITLADKQIPEEHMKTYETEYNNLYREEQNGKERIEKVKESGYKAYALAKRSVALLNGALQPQKTLSPEETYSREQILTSLANLGYTVKLHAPSQRYLITNPRSEEVQQLMRHVAAEQEQDVAENIKKELLIENFDLHATEFEDRETRDWDRMETQLGADVSILEDIAQGKLAELDPKERFPLLTRIARVTEALQNFQFTPQYGQRLTKEQAKLPFEEKQQLQTAKQAETQEFIAKRQRINRLVATLKRYGFQVIDRREGNDSVHGSQRYRIDPDLATFNEIVQNGGLPSEPARPVETPPATELPAVPEAKEKGSDTLKPSLREVSEALTRSAQISDILEPETLQNTQDLLTSTVEPFLENGRRDYLIYKPDRGFVPATAQRYTEQDGPKLEVPRAGIVNKDAAQIVANVLSQVPLGNASTRESGTTHEQFRHRVFTDAQGKFRIERTPERLVARNKESLAPGTVPESAFSFVNLERDSDAPETANPDEAFSFVNLPRTSAEELEVINDTVREREPASETNSLADAETLAAAFDSAREGLREIGIPSTREEALEFQHHLDDTVAPYAREDSELTRRFLPLTDSYEDSVLELPVTNLASREAAEVAATALNLLRPDQAPGSPEYYVLEGPDGSYSLEIKQTAPTGLAESGEDDEWDLPDEEEGYINPFDLENSPALDAERDSAADDLDNPFALG